MLRGGHGGKFRWSYQLVIPGPSEARSLESIIACRGYGFRARHFVAPRNDGVRMSCKTRALFDVRALGPFAGADLGAVGLHTRDLEAAVGAHDRDALCVDRDNLAELAGDAFRILRRHRLRVE